MDENEVSEPRHGGLRWKLFVLNIYIYFFLVYMVVVALFMLDNESNLREDMNRLVIEDLRRALEDSDFWHAKFFGEK